MVQLGKLMIIPQLNGRRPFSLLLHWLRVDLRFQSLLGHSLDPDHSSSSSSSRSSSSRRGKQGKGRSGRARKGKWGWCDPKPPT